MRTLLRPVRMSIACLAAGGAVWLAGCVGDPFDPLIGPRLPDEGAERYLRTRADIPDIQKYRLLQHEPVAAPWLIDLARSPSREIRFYVAMNPAAPPAVLEALAGDREVGVRQAVTRHSALPRASARQLLGDPSVLVRWDALASPVWSAKDLLGLIAQGHDAYGIARNPNITPEIEAALLSAPSAEGAKAALADNPKASCATLRLLQKDARPSIGAAASDALEERRRNSRGC